MRFQAELETRPHPPIEIPRCEMILPMPREWFDFINNHGIGVVHMLSCLLCQQWQFLGDASLRKDFQTVFEGLGDYPIPPASDAEMVRAIIPMRLDIFVCLEAAGELAGKSTHEVACRILARQLPLFAGNPLPRLAPTKGRKAAVSAGKIIQFLPAHA